jgi:hypothetical protein
MTFGELMYNAAQRCVDEREAHLIIFTEGLNGYVCPNEGLTNESRAVFKGTYRDCQVWVERRGISAALRYVLEHQAEVPELGGVPLTVAQCLEQFSSLPRSSSGR